MSEKPGTCVEPLAFPRRIENRPGLDRVAYRIGTFADFRDMLLRRINVTPELAAWTHRTADDPGIALLESAAIVADVLTLYQERYANEAWLRTATWRESVADLVRLLGYRLSPGLGGRATFAVVAKGTLPLQLSARFPIKADLADVPDPADFETREPLTAYPHLSRFRMYRPRQYAGSIPLGATRFEIEAVAGNAAPAAIQALELKKGDKLFLVPPPQPWFSSGGLGAPQESGQIVVVSKVTDVLDRRIVEIEGSLSRAWPRPVAAYRVNRTFRHFGHNAPAKKVSATPATGTITGSSQSNIDFVRHPYHDCIWSGYDGSLPAARVPLDQEVSDLSVGGAVVIQMPVTASTASSRTVLTLVRTIGTVSAGPAAFGNLSGASTFLDLTAPLLSNAGLSLDADIREFRIHEVTSPALQLRPAAGFPSSSDPLSFFGTQAEAVVLAGRALALVGEDGRELHLTCTATPSAFVLAAGAADVARMWPVSLDRPLAPFTLAEFEETAPRVTVYGNLVEATQGKTANDLVLGSGDDAAAFQTFKLPKSPLTFHLAAGVTPPEVPALELYVDGRLWTQVDTLFGQAPDAEAYIVREGADGSHFVQGGDGRTGRRFPTGINNVVATLRAGSGAHGPIKPGVSPTAGTTPPGLDTIRMIGVVAGGSDREAADKAKEAAPGKVQGLGRLVSIRDYETETLAIPGVVATSASWDIRDGVPTLTLKVLLAGGREAEFEQIRQTIAGYQRCRGPDRFALRV
ncbi:MAG TPA: hypothetical protein VJ817_15160, partial [Gemmatimonadales bacterium]|nr:hypothetical protein [Gemmatimonadales bacterium]